MGGGRALGMNGYIATTLKMRSKLSVATDQEFEKDPGHLSKGEYRGYIGMYRVTV